MTTEKHGRVISYSQYRLWATCPLMWKLTYVDHLAPDEDTIHNVFGLAMHETIQHWVDLYYNKSRSVARMVDLSDMLKDRMIHHFKNVTREENGVKVFVCDKHTLMEFYEDGVAIIKFLQAKAADYFQDHWGLEGVEIPLRTLIVGDVYFVGYCDIILRHKLTGAIKIIDLKTSTKGWNHWKKDDKVTTNQLLLYKHYYAKQFKLPEDAIEVEFLVLKRKLSESSQYPQKRVLAFKPSHGKISMVRATQDFNKFVAACFDQDGQFKTDQCQPTPSKSNCMFCPFHNQPERCSVSAWKD